MHELRNKIPRWLSTFEMMHGILAPAARPASRKIDFLLWHLLLSAQPPRPQQSTSMKRSSSSLRWVKHKQWQPEINPGHGHTPHQLDPRVSKNKQTNKHVSRQTDNSKRQTSTVDMWVYRRRNSDYKNAHFFFCCIQRKRKFLILTPFSDSIAVDSLKRQASSARPHLRSRRTEELFP